MSDGWIRYPPGSIVAICDWDGEKEYARFIVTESNHPQRIVAGYCIMTTMYGFSVHRVYPLQTYRLRTLYSAFKPL